MALVLKDRVKEQSTTTGTGTLTLSGAFDGYQAFSVIGNGNGTYYTIYDPASGDWEVGYGTYTASGTTLSRTFVYDSSNSGNLVNFAAGTKEVFCTYPSEQAIYQETNGNLRLVGGVIGLSQDGTEGTTLPNTSFQAFTTGNYYMQANQQNLSSGAEASSDWVATADNGTDTENYMDVGIASSGYNYAGFSAFKPNTGYIVSTGSDLRLIAGKYGAVTPGAQDIVLVAGSLLDTEERIRVYGDTGNVNIGGGVNATDLGQRLQVVGSASISGAATFGSTVTLNADPSTALQAATKQYVDNAVSNGFHVHEPVLVATTGNLTATYNNGSSGVGATLTNSGAQAAISIDGVSLSVNDRVLVWQQSSQVQNGVYVVTTVGSGSTNWVLTRSSDADTYAPQSDTGLGGGDYFFVSSGATLGFSSYVCTNDGTITFGTTAITFQQFSTVPSYVVNAPLSLTGNTLSLSGVVAVANGGTNVSSYTSGDTLYATGATTLNKLGIGSTGQAMIVSGGLPVWGALDMAGAGVAGVLPVSHGGTNQSSYATGDTLYASATNTLSKLSGNTTTTRKFLSQTGTGSASQAPSWDTVAASDITSGTLAVARGGTGLGSYAVGDIVYASGTGTLAGLADVVTGNVLLSGGTNTAPAYGKVGLTTHVSGTLPVANGGTGQTTAQAAMNALAGAVTSGYYLRGNGTNVVMAAISAGDVPTLNQNTTGSAGSVVNAVTFNNGGAGDASGTTFNGSAARTISYNTVGASPLAGSTSLTTTGTVTTGTWSGLFGAVSGANLTNLTAGNLSGTIPSAVLGNSTHYIGTTAVTLNRASANLGLTGITSIAMPGSTSGTVTIQPAATAGTTTITFPATTGTVVTSGDTGTVTNTMLAGSIANAKLANSSVTINGSAVSLGGSITVTATATNALTIGSYLTGSSYNGSAAVTIAADATSANTASKLVARDASGNFSAGTITATLSGNASTATALQGTTSGASGTFYTDVNWSQLMQGFTTGGAFGWRATSATSVAFSCTAAGAFSATSFSGAGTGLTGTAASLTTGYCYNTTQGFNSNWNTDFQNAPAGSTILRGDTSTGSSTGGPGGTWWFQQNMRHTNGSNYWGTQVAWGWEDNANVLKTRNVQGGTFGAWVTYINSNNIGSQSVASATNATNATNLTGTAGTCGYSTSGQSIAYTSVGGPQVMGNGGGAAMLSFHRPGAYAINFGLDTDNVLKVGGWSMGGVAYPIVHTGSSNLVTRAMMYKGSNDGAAVLCGADGAIFLNPNTINNSTTIPASYNGVSAGPITIATGVTVTVSTGANWVIN